MRLLFSFFIGLMACVSVAKAAKINKPQGIYVSHVNADADQYMGLPYVSGALIRVRWSEIEPVEGRYDFSRIESQLKSIRAAGKNWSLGVIAGRDVPRWLLQKTDERMAIQFRGKSYQIVPFWNRSYQGHAAKLAQALANQYGGDPKLALIYVPQQTANGIEGHFNGTPFDDLRAAGLTQDHWLAASESAIKAYTKAFPDKAIAFELHELYRSTEIPAAVMNYIAKNHKAQVGIGVWWLSGKWNYQGDLLKLIQQSGLPVYAQVIGNSSQAHRFPGGDYSKMFDQARIIGANYVEVWNYELEKPVEPSVTSSIKAFAAEFQ